MSREKKPDEQQQSLGLIKVADILPQVPHFKKHLPVVKPNGPVATLIGTAGYSRGHSFLDPLIQRELVYRSPRTPQGESLRAMATRGDLNLQEWACPRTLHHQFRALMAVSPLQYKKQLS